MVVSARLGNKFITSPSTEEKLCIYVYLVDDDHFHVITSITGFFSTIYFCERCLKQYNNKEKRKFWTSNFPMTLIVAIEFKRAKVLLNKPSYFSMIILDLTKYAVYDFYYNYLKKKYGSKLELQMSDTDSFLYHVQTDDLYLDKSSV